MLDPVTSELNFPVGSELAHMPPWRWQLAVDLMQALMRAHDRAKSVAVAAESTDTPRTPGSSPGTQRHSDGGWGQLRALALLPVSSVLGRIGDMLETRLGAALVAAWRESALQLEPTLAILDQACYTRIRGAGTTRAASHKPASGRASSARRSTATGRVSIQSLVAQWLAMYCTRELHMPAAGFNIHWYLVAPHVGGNGEDHAPSLPASMSTTHKQVMQRSVCHNSHFSHTPRTLPAVPATRAVPSMDTELGAALPHQAPRGGLWLAAHGRQDSCCWRFRRRSWSGRRQGAAACGGSIHWKGRSLARLVVCTPRCVDG